MLLRMSGTPKNQWLDDLIRAKGMRRPGFAKLVGLPASRISEIVYGSRAIKSDELPTFAKALDMDLYELLRSYLGAEVVDETTVRSTIKAKSLGLVSAGTWGPAVSWEPDDDRAEVVTVALDYPEHAEDVFLLEVAGESMNRRFPDGAKLLCVPTFKWKRPIQSEMTVVAERRHCDGTHEATVKELEIKQDGSYLLWPDSEHPDHQEPIELPPVHLWPRSIDSADDEQIYISAVVLSASLSLA